MLQHCQDAGRNCWRKARQSVSRNWGRIDFKWTSPDMRAELKAGVKVQPPTPQVQQNEKLESQAA